MSPSIDEGTATQKGINDKIAETIWKFLANPDVGSNDQRVIFGVMQLTCQPGTLTRKDYSANLNVSIKYARDAEDEAPEKGIPNPSEKTSSKLKEDSQV